MVPVMLFLSALEFKLVARIQGQKITRKEALKVVTIASAANFLPLPGSAMVRVAALKKKGVSLKKGTLSLLYSSIIFAGMAFTFAGTCLLFMGFNLAGIFHLFIGFPLLGVSFFIALNRLQGRAGSYLLFPNRFIMVVAESLRIYLALIALNINSSFGDAAVLVTSGIVGLAVSIVPAGLGVREATAAILAPIIGLSAFSVFLATSLMRLIDMGIVSIMALWVTKLHLQESLEEKSIEKGKL